MQYILTLSDDARAYLLATVERTVIKDAARLGALDQKKSPLEYQAARGALHTGAAVLSDLSPERLPVATDGGLGFRPAPVALYGNPPADFPPGSTLGAVPVCIHGISADDPCELCADPIDSITGLPK